MAQIGGGMRNSAIDSSDRTQLLQDDVETRGRSCCTHKRLLCFFIALLLIIAGHVIAIYYIHLKQNKACRDGETCNFEIYSCLN